MISLCDCSRIPAFNRPGCVIKSCRLQARGRYELRSCSYRDDATNGCNGTDLELVSNRTAWVRGETSRVKGEGLGKSNSTRAISSSIGSVGDRLLLFRASRDSLLSLVRGSRLSTSFVLYLSRWPRDGYRHQSDARAFTGAIIITRAASRWDSTRRDPKQHASEAPSRSLANKPTIF